MCFSYSQGLHALHGVYHLARLVITSADLLNRILFHDWVMAIFPFRITDKLTIHPPLMVPAFGLLNNWLSEQIFDNGPGGLFALCCGQVVLFLFWRCGQDCQCYFSTGCPWPYLQLTFPYFCPVERDLCKFLFVMLKNT